MKFTPKETIKARGKTWEAGNTYDTELYDGVDDDNVERWYQHGLTEIEGRDAAPERKVTRAKLEPHNTKIGVDATEG